MLTTGDAATDVGRCKMVRAELVVIRPKRQVRGAILQHVRNQLAAVGQVLQQIGQRLARLLGKRLAVASEGSRIIDFLPTEALRTASARGEGVDEYQSRWRGPSYSGSPLRPSPHALRKHVPQTFRCTRLRDQLVDHIVRSLQKHTQSCWAFLVIEG